MLMIQGTCRNQSCLLWDNASCVGSCYYFLLHSFLHFLLEPSGTSQGFSDQNYFPRVHFPHFKRRIGRILLIPPRALCCFRLQQPRRAAAETWGCSHHHYSRNPLHPMWLPPWPWNTSMEAFMPLPATGRLGGSQTARCSQVFHSYWRGCAGRCAEEAPDAAPHQPLGSREPWCSPGHMQQDSFCLQRAEKR